MYLLINGVKYHLQIDGEGPPLLLLHGFTGSSSNWEPFVSNWMKNYTVIRFDHIGHGKSDCIKDFKRYSMEETINDILAILEQLRVDKVNVLGYSMGGRIALGLAATAPEKMNSLILESSSPGLLFEEERQKRRENDEALAYYILEKGIEKFIDKWESIPLFESQQKLPQDLKDKLQRQRLSNSTLGLANSLRGIGTGSQPSFWNKLREINIPTLLLVGKLDIKFCKIAEKMVSIMPNAEKIEISGAGHAIHVECPEFFGKIVMEWLYDKK